MDPIRGQYTLTFDEFKEASRAQLRRRRFLSGEPDRSPWLGCAWIAGLLAAVLIAMVTVVAIERHGTPKPLGAEETTSSTFAFLIDWAPWIVVCGLLWLILARSPIERRLAKRMIGIVLVLGASMAWVDAIQDSSVVVVRTTRDHSLLPYVPWMLLLGGSAIILTDLRRRGTRIAWEGQPSARETIDFEATEAHLLIASRLSRTEYTWGAFVSYSETPNLFVVFVSALSFQSIPKRAFVNGVKDIDAFRQLLIEKMPNANPQRQGFEIQLPPIAQRADVR